MATQLMRISCAVTAGALSLGAMGEEERDGAHPGGATATQARAIQAGAGTHDTTDNPTDNPTQGDPLQ